MIDYTSLVKNSNAYKIMMGDKAFGRLSHAYLILTADEDNLSQYLKVFAKIIACEDSEPCLKCRACTLIEKDMHPDVLRYPQQEKTISVAHVNALIEECYLKPIELGKKIFVLENAQTMNASAQNKLLKTLEEPPENVYILLGATTEFALLPTIKSRVKKLEIPAIDSDTLLSVLKEECPDAQRLSLSIACGDGTVGKALALYGDKDFNELTELIVDLLLNMNSSKDVLKYSTLILDKKVEIGQVLSILECLLRDMLVELQCQSELVGNKGLAKRLKGAINFSEGAIIHSLDTITKAQMRKKFNVNSTMLIEWVLFQILEGKYKWQKF